AYSGRPPPGRTVRDRRAAAGFLDRRRSPVDHPGHDGADGPAGSDLVRAGPSRSGAVSHRRIHPRGGARARHRCQRAAVPVRASRAQGARGSGDGEPRRTRSPGAGVHHDGGPAGAQPPRAGVPGAGRHHYLRRAGVHGLSAGDRALRAPHPVRRQRPGDGDGRGRRRRLARGRRAAGLHLLRDRRPQPPGMQPEPRQAPAPGAAGAPAPRSAGGGRRLRPAALRQPRAATARTGRRVGAVRRLVQQGAGAGVSGRMDRGARAAAARAGMRQGRVRPRHQHLQPAGGVGVPGFRALSGSPGTGASGVPRPPRPDDRRNRRPLSRGHTVERSPPRRAHLGAAAGRDGCRRAVAAGPRTGRGLRSRLGVRTAGKHRGAQRAAAELHVLAPRPHSRGHRPPGRGASQPRL
ncbi:MAG: Transcriptional regulator, GntR family domain / Aspartate aminotransferase, partial [uncultured Gemmatimonadetes bacterium]